METEHVTGAGTVLERVRELLLADEARHNLAPKILSTAVAHPGVYGEVRGWVVRDGDRIVRAAPQTPPHNLVLPEVAGHPVLLACFGGTTPSGISAVSTPSEHRGRGYGSAVIAAVSQLNLDGGRRFCLLYTDVANPTSNSIYVRIGYELVCDSRELASGPPRA